MPADEENESAEEKEVRENALRFIRHPSAFVYSEEDYASLRRLVHDGLTEPPEAPGLQETEQ
jgi:hypothetical protein